MIELRDQMLQMIPVDGELTQPAPLLIVNSTQHKFVNLDVGKKGKHAEFHLFEMTVRLLCCFREMQPRCSQPCTGGRLCVLL